jgi:hypothetical protein
LFFAQRTRKTSRIIEKIKFNNRPTGFSFEYANVGMDITGMYLKKLKSKERKVKFSTFGEAKRCIP